jgi:hypothetical protein
LKQHSSRRAALAGAAFCGAVALGPACADDIYSGLATPHTSWSLFAGALRTDNATLEPGGPGDTIATAGIDASVYRNTGHLKLDFDGSVRYEDYLDHTYPSHTLGQLVGTAQYAFVPERFAWMLQDTYGQATINPLAPTTPQNRINANYASTGPDAALPLGSTLDLLLGARYAQANFQSNPVAQVDNHTVSANLGLRERLSPASSLSINATASRLEYSGTPLPGYDQESVYGRFDSRSARGGVALDLGASQLKQNGQTVRDPLARLTLFHRLTPSWNVNLSVSSEFQNSAQALQSALANERVLNGQLVNGGTSSAGGPPGSTVADINLTQAPFRSDSARLAFDFVRPRTTFDVSGAVTHQRYQFQLGSNGFDRDITDAGAAFTRRLRPTLDFHVDGNYEYRKPLAALPADHTTSADAGLGWRAGTMLAVSLDYLYEQRSTEVGGLPYKSNRIYLGVTYGPPRPHVAFETPGQLKGQPAPP